MKVWPALLLTLCSVSQGLRAQDPIPQAFPPERYAAMLANSPFALATPVAPPPPPTERGFAADWYVTGLARFEDKDFVSIKSRDLATSFSLYGNEESNGVTLVGVEWSDERGKSTVTVKKGGEIARLEFNQAEVAAAGAAAPPTGQAPQSGRGPTPQGQAPRPIGAPPVTQPVTGAPFGTPRASGSIPRPTNVPTAINQPVVNQPVVGQPSLGQAPTMVAPTALPTGNEPAPSENRRRIRVINPK